MHRILMLLVMLTGALLSSITLGESVPTIGIVTYQMDARAGDVLSYEAALSSELNATVIIREAVPHEFCFVSAESANLARISHAGAEIRAMEELIADGADVIVLTPAPYAQMLRPDIDELSKQVPIALTMRRVPELDLPYSGFDAYELGHALAASSEPHGSQPFAVIGYFTDPMQAEFLEGLMTSPNFRGAYEVLSGGGQSEASTAILDHSDLVAIIVTEPAYVAGVAEIVKYTATELHRSLRVGSLGLPPGWEDLFAQDLLHGAISWDNYQLILQASIAAREMFLKGGTPADEPTDAIFYASPVTQTIVKYPYDDMEVLGQVWK